MELTPFEKRLAGLVESSKSRGRNRFRNSLAHLSKGWALKEIDKEMAAFRAITAEEEAATGLMYTLQEMSYLHAERLQPRSHIHKAAVIPFIAAIAPLFKDVIESNSLKPQLRIESTNGQEQLAMVFIITINGEEKELRQVPPLDFNITVDGKRISFRAQLDGFVKKYGISSFEDQIKREANLRNQILYASDKGYPNIEKIEDAFFHRRKHHIFILICAYLLILPHKKEQLFVQHAIEVFLTFVGNLKDTDLHPDV